MTDETNPTGKPPEQPAASAAASVVPPVEPTPPATETTEEPFDKERAMQTIQALRAIEKQGKKDAKELEQLRAEKQQRAEAEMTEAQKAQTRAEKAEAEAAKLKLDILRRDVIAETGLPAVFADRLQGATKDEMLADAKTLAEALPKATIKNPKLPPTNPADADKAETDAQKRERLFGPQGGNVFDMNSIKAKGGGVVINR